MLSVNHKTILEVSGLSFEDHHLVCHQTIEEVLYLEEACDITIKSGAHVKIVDCCLDGIYSITVEKDAVLNYQLLCGSNGFRTIACSGTLEVLQIATEKTEETLEIHLLDPNATASVDLLAVSLFKQTFHQKIIHDAPNTTSNISNHAVALKGAVLLLDTVGKITKGMARSVCRQSSKGIVMDDDSKITSCPILLIDEYDVVANHGAAIGKMSDESLFYLMSRGLKKTEAFLLILEGIIAPFIRMIQDETLKQKIADDLRKIIQE